MKGASDKPAPAPGPLLNLMEGRPPFCPAASRKPRRRRIRIDPEIYAFIAERKAKRAKKGTP
jgi:hypothetical protein